MSARQGIPSAMRKLALAAALAAVSVQASALIVADGKLDGNNGSAEGYQLGLSFGILDDHGTTHTGKLYFGQDVNGQSVYIQMPLGFIDNTYGDQATSLNGWFNGHSFMDLLSGDTQTITWKDANAGNAVQKAKIDYLADCPSGCSSSGYLSAGAGPNLSNGAGGGGAGWDYVSGAGILTGTGASLKNIATSLEYNLNNVANVTSNSSTSSSWIKEVGYEVQFAAGTFNAADWVNKDKAPGLITLDVPGMSPTKKTFKDYTPPTCIYGCTNVPEPSTTWLLGLGALSLLWYARRRQDRAPVAYGRLPAS